MVDEAFDFARVVAADDVADYLTSLAQELIRGDVKLGSGGRVLHLVPPVELKLDLQVREGAGKSELILKLSWKCPILATTADLRVGDRSS